MGHPIGGALLSVAFDIAALLMAYLLARSVAGPVAGLTVAALWAVAPILITYGSSQWNPQLMPFFALLAVYAALRIARGEGRWLMLLVPSFLVAWQIHDPALFLAPMLAAIVVWRRRTIDRSTVAAATALGVLVTLPFLIQQATNGLRDVRAMAAYGMASLTGLGPEPDVPFGLQRLVLTAEGLERALPGPDVVNLLIILLAVVGVVAAVIGLRTPNRPDWIVVLLLAATPLLFLFWRAPFHSHYLYLFYSLPLFMAAIGLAALVRIRRRLLAPVAFVALGAVVLATAFGTFGDIAEREPTSRRWDNRLAAVRDVIADASGEPFALRVISDQKPRDGWRAPWMYAFFHAGTEPAGVREDLPTYVLFDPASFGNGESLAGNLVEDVRWVRFEAPATGDSLLGTEAWSFDGRGQGSSTDGPDPTVELSPSFPFTRLDSRKSLDVESGTDYLVSLEFRTPGRLADAAVFLQVFGPQGGLLTTLPTGAGLRVGAAEDWTPASFIGHIPERAARATLVLRGRGLGTLQFRNVAVREVLLDGAPRE